MVTIVVGGQYGSEAKGKCVVHLANKYGCALAVRTGGPNAGHTVWIRDQKYVTRQLPSALAVPGVQIAIGAGGMINVALLDQEIASLKALGVEVANRLWIDPFAVVMSEGASNHERTIGLGDRLGSTQTGTGSTQSARILRCARIARDEMSLRPYLYDVTMAVNKLHDAGRRVIIEGTQGFGLSMLHGGCYPFCTSRDTSASGFASEVGVSPKAVDQIFMVLRRFPIRVGGNSGPMSHEVTWDAIREISGYPNDITEMTSVTKKVRRVAMFDWNLLQRAVMVNRPTDLVLAGLDYNNYEDLGKITWDSLSEKSKAFVRELQSRTHVHVSQLYTGPHQNHLIDMDGDNGQMFERQSEN